MLSFVPGFGSPMKALPKRRASVMTVLDVGTTKIVCVIAKLKPVAGDRAVLSRTHAVEVIGFGHHRARGIKGGCVVNLEEAEKAIRLAVDKAERQAGMTVDSLVVNITGGRIGSNTFSADVALAGHEIEQADIARVLQAGRGHVLDDGMAVVHSMPIGYSLDGNKGIKDPRGMLGERLGVDMHVVTAHEAPLKNLELAINRCHLAVDGFVVTPYASGLAAVVNDEAEMGVACIDMGGGTTSVSVFVEGEFVHCDAIAIGGNHVTTDLARGLSTSLQSAERIKVKYGNALPLIDDPDDIITVPPIDGGDNELPVNIPRTALHRMITPRVEETFELIRDRLNASGFASLVGRRMVLTGGASQLTGVSEVARKILAKNVRLGRPLGVAGLPDVARGPAFSAAMGLLIYPQLGQIEQHLPSAQPIRRMTGTGGYFSRMGSWLKESF